MVYSFKVSGANNYQAEERYNDRSGITVSEKNNTMKKLARNWELLGVVVIFFAGATLHFVFEWSGYWKPIAWFVAINESTWEHFKLAFWPGIVWALIGYFTIGKVARNYWFAKALGLLSMPVVIAAVFYSYTAVSGKNYLWVDILSFLFAVSVGQFISYKVFLIGKLNMSLQWVAVFAIMGMILAFVFFTYMPPQIFIFEHVKTHEYGILKHYQ